MQLKLTLKKLNLQKIFKERVINIYLENYVRFKWENLVVYHVSRFYIKNKKTTDSLFAYFVFVYPPSFTPCISFYLFINLSDLTLPQITDHRSQSATFQLPTYPTHHFMCVTNYIHYH